MNGAIRTEHLEKKFHRVEALRDFNLDVPTGAIYALVGPNGAGKTTAIKILMNIFPATSGHAEVLGTDLTSLPDEPSHRSGTSRKINICPTGCGWTRSSLT